MQKIRRATFHLCGIALLMAPASVHADDIAHQSSGETVSPIIVTGSRLSSSELRGIEPLVIVRNRQIAERNYSHFADALNDLPGFRGGVTPEGPQAQFGQGVNFINAYGLGSNRTLTLINGKRAVSSNGPTIFSAAGPGLQVDLNGIPSILVDRVERLSIGGAPAYGSDAIAATVNVLLRRKIEGIEIDALSGVSAQGDNFRWKLAAAGGQPFANGRGHITLAASFDQVNGAASNSRAAYRANLGKAPNPCSAFQPGLCSPFGTLAMLGPAGRTAATDGRVNPAIGFNDAADDGNPASLLIRDFALAAVAPGGVISSGAGAYAFRFAADGSLVPYKRGSLFSAPLSGPLAAASISSGGDGLTLMDRIAITSDLERLHSAAFVQFDLSSELRFYADGLYYRGTSSEPADLPTFNAVHFGGASGALTFRTDNPFLSQQAREQLSNLGYDQTFQISRANTDLADRSGESRNEVFRIVAGLEGQTQIAARSYHYEFSVNFGRSSFTDFGNAISRQNFVNAINVATIGGAPACVLEQTVTGLPGDTGAIADPACVPLNLFGEGAPSPAALDYILQPTRTASRLEQFSASADFGGSPFDLFGNAVSFSMALEHRQEKARFSPDPFLEAGLGRSVPIAPVAGSYSVNAIIGEMVLPVLTPQNNALFSKLVAYARARHVKNNTVGAFTAWSAGASFAPIRDLEFRGNITRSFRAPAILELFAPRAVEHVAVPDLCSASNIGSGPVPQVRQANCAAFLARYPAATPLIAATASVPGLTGGNPQLRSEQANSYTLGATLRPRFLPGLIVSLDYLDIRISGPISRLSVADIARGCFDNTRFDVSDPANANQFCSLIRRDATGQVLSDSQSPGVVSGYVNGKRISFSGSQAALEYAASLSAIGVEGQVDLRADIFHLRRRVVDITGMAPARSDGLIGDPRWQGQFGIRYANRIWGLLGQANYTGKQLLARDNRGVSPNDTREIDHLRAFATFDASLFFKLENGLKLTASVTNAFNRMGQSYFGYLLPFSINDALGRRLSVSLNMKL